jgi:hypothetical protein
VLSVGRIRKRRPLVHTTATFLTYMFGVAFSERPRALRITEDDRDRVRKQIQELAKQFENRVNDFAKTRQVEVLED